jgi:hypothetical protein
MQQNAEAGDLAKAAARNALMHANVFFQVLEGASIKTALPEARVINIIKGEDWRAPIMAYLRHYYEPDSKKQANQNAPVNERLTDSQQ